MVRYDTGDTGIMRMYKDDKGRMHGKYVEIYGLKRFSDVQHQGRTTLHPCIYEYAVKFEGIVYQANASSGERRIMNFLSMQTEKN